VDVSESSTQGQTVQKPESYISDSTGLSLHVKTVANLSRSGQLKMTTKLNEQKQCCEEGEAKIPPQQAERPISSNRKQILQIIAA